MPALTKTQLEHAKTRIEAAKDAYFHRHMAALGEEPDVIEYTEEQQEAMIRAGTAVLKPAGRRRSYANVFDFFTYPDTPEMAAAREALTAWQAKRDAVQTSACSIKEKLLDELVMSPDGVSALQRIAAAFEG